MSSVTASGCRETTVPVCKNEIVWLLEGTENELFVASDVIMTRNTISENQHSYSEEDHLPPFAKVAA